MATYRNPWHSLKNDSDAAFYNTDAKPVQVGRFTRYHRIKGSSSGSHCYDFVLAGVCVSQRCGPASAEIIEGDERVQALIRQLGLDAHEREPFPAAALPTPTATPRSA